MSNFRISRGSGFQMFFSNDWGISVQFGYGAYCDLRDKPDLSSRILDGKEITYDDLGRSCENAEVAIFVPGGAFLRLANDDVQGWVSPDTVAALIEVVSSAPEKPTEQELKNFSEIACQILG